MAHNHGNKEALTRGILIFTILTIFTAVEFAIALYVPILFLLVVVAVIKAGLVLYYFMHVYKLNEEDETQDEESYEYKTRTNRLGLWLFLLSDSFVFLGLLVARFNLLGMTRPHLNQNLGLVVTFVLLISSFFMNRAEVQMGLGNIKGFLTNTLITMLLGFGFVIGVVGVEWQLAKSEGVLASTSVGGAVFYMMTGMHAFHVLTGVIFLFVVWRNARKGVYTQEKHFAVEAATVYWHFVDLVWIFFYPALYLIGVLLG